MNFVGQFILVFVELIALIALFLRFGNIRGWTLPEVALFYGITHIGFAFAEGLARGFDLFGRMVKGGDFDRLLLRPRSTLLQVAGSEVQLMRVGRVLQGGAMLWWGASQLAIHWSIAKIFLLFFTLAGAISLFYGLLILQATIAFWTIESLELMHILTYGGVEAGQYPLSIYAPWLRHLFTFCVPLACVNYIPLGLVFNTRHDFVEPQAWNYLAPLAGFLFLWCMTRFWKVGERRYTSTGT